MQAFPSSCTCLWVVGVCACELLWYNAKFYSAVQRRGRKSNPPAQTNRLLYQGTFNHQRHLSASNFPRSISCILMHLIIQQFYLFGGGAGPVNCTLNIHSCDHKDSQQHLSWRSNHFIDKNSDGSMVDYPAMSFVHLYWPDTEIHWSAVGQGELQARAYRLIYIYIYSCICICICIKYEL